MVEYRKTTVSLPKDVAEYVEARVSEDNVTMTSVVAEALRLDKKLRACGKDVLLRDPETGATERVVFL